MDVGKEEHRVLLNKLHLLFGVVTYSAGKLGQEPVRSQGHIHKISPYSGWSTPEIYEIWSGEAIIYMQEYAEDQRSMLCGTCLSGGCSDRSSIGDMRRLVRIRDCL